MVNKEVVDSNAKPLMIHTERKGDKAPPAFGVHGAAHRRTIHFSLRHSAKFIARGAGGGRLRTPAVRLPYRSLS
ncbi:MAG: hypothetical protein R3D25_17145 [Geminicoccaceae bacterium]